MGKQIWKVTVSLRLTRLSIVLESQWQNLFSFESDNRFTK
jgi:hypothetical protein